MYVCRVSCHMCPYKTLRCMSRVATMINMVLPSGAGEVKLRYSLSVFSLHLSTTQIKLLYPIFILKSGFGTSPPTCPKFTFFTSTFHWEWLWILWIYPALVVEQYGIAHSNMSLIHNNNQYKPHDQTPTYIAPNLTNILLKWLVPIATDCFMNKCINKLH